MTKRKVDRETVLKVCKVLGVVLVCAIAFAYAVVYIVRQGRFSESYSPDEGHYIAMAQRLLTEGYYSYWGGAPDAYVSPGYPIFLTLCMAVFGTDLQGIDAIKFVQALLSAGTVFLTFFLGWRLTKKYSVGILGALLATFFLVLPSVVVILVIARFLKAYQQNRLVQGAFACLRPAVAGLVGAAGFSGLKIALLTGAPLADGLFAALNLPALALFAVLLVLPNAKRVKNLHPILFIAAGAVAGVLLRMH